MGIVQAGGESAQLAVLQHADVAVVGLLVFAGLADVHLSAGTDGDRFGLLQPGDDLRLLSGERCGRHQRESYQL